MSAFTFDSHDATGEREIPRLPPCPRLSPSEIDWITKQVFVPSNPHTADVLFVFGSSCGDKWSQVADLHKKNPAPIVFVGGGGVLTEDGRRLSHHIKEELVSFGVDRNTIFTDNRGQNSLEEVQSGRDFFIREGIRHDAILFASKAPHSGRCFRTLRKVFPGSSIFVASYDFEYEGLAVTSDGWWKHPITRSVVFGEYLRICEYSRRGDISDTVF